MEKAPERGFCMSRRRMFRKRNPRRLPLALGTGIVMLLAAIASNSGGGGNQALAFTSPGGETCPWCSPGP